MKDLEKICNEQEKCKNCPLLISRKVEDDPTYDYHETIVCYKRYWNVIEKIHEFIHSEDKED